MKRDNNIESTEAGSNEHRKPPKPIQQGANTYFWKAFFGGVAGAGALLFLAALAIGIFANPRSHDHELKLVEQVEVLDLEPGQYRSDRLLSAATDVAHALEAHENATIHIQGWADATPWASCSNAAEPTTCNREHNLRVAQLRAHELHALLQDSGVEAYRINTTARISHEDGGHRRGIVVQVYTQTSEEVGFWNLFDQRNEADQNSSANRLIGNLQETYMQGLERRIASLEEANRQQVADQQRETAADNEQETRVSQAMLDSLAAHRDAIEEATLGAKRFRHRVLDLRAELNYYKEQTEEDRGRLRVLLEQFIEKHENHRHHRRKQSYEKPKSLPQPTDTTGEKRDSAEAKTLTLTTGAVVWARNGADVAVPLIGTQLRIRNNTHLTASAGFTPWSRDARYCNRADAFASLGIQYKFLETGLFTAREVCTNGGPGLDERWVQQDDGLYLSVIGQFSPLGIPLEFRPGLTLTQHRTAGKTAQGIDPGLFIKALLKW